MHKLIITTYNARVGGVCVTVMEFEYSEHAKATYDALISNKDFPLARTVELLLANEIKS